MVVNKSYVAATNYCYTEPYQSANWSICFGYVLFYIYYYAVYATSVNTILWNSNTNLRRFFSSFWLNHTVFLIFFLLNLFLLVGKFYMRLHVTSLKLILHLILLEIRTFFVECQLQNDVLRNESDAVKRNVSFFLSIRRLLWQYCQTSWNPNCGVIMVLFISDFSGYSRISHPYI